MYGGFATWHIDTGLVLHRTVDPEAWDGRYAYAGTARDEEAGTHCYTVRTLNGGDSDSDVQNLEYTNCLDCCGLSAQQFAFPQGITVNGDNGDYYVTADVASYSSVFRIREADQFIDDLYRSGSENTWTFFGLVSIINS